MYSTSIYLAIDIAYSLKPLAIWCFMSFWAIGGLAIVASLGLGLWLMFHTKEIK